MSRLRTHIVSVVAVMMALAVGIALGAGPLQSEVVTRPAAAPDEEQVTVEEQARLDRLEEALEFADSFALRLSRPLVRGALSNRAVTVVSLPGASPTEVRRLVEMVGSAGGRVVSRVVIDEQLLDVGNRQLVGELGTQMSTARRTRVAVPEDAGDYEKVGRLLARAFVTTARGGDDADTAARSIVAGLETAGLVQQPDGVGRRGSAVLVVGGPPYGTADQREGATTIVATLLAGMARSADAVLMAGPVTAGHAGGLVQGLRADATARRAISTVDTVDTAAGAVVAVRALGADARGRPGHYGSASASGGALPPLR